MKTKIKFFITIIIIIIICSIFIPLGLYFKNKCPNNCSNNGTCLNGKCTCKNNWGGIDCSNLIKKCNRITTCSNHGDCNPDESCKCDPDYTGIDCSNLIKKCNRITTCSNHGDCNPDGTCKCDTGYTGINCNNTPCTRITTCSNHGDCNPDGTCKCDTGYTGINCNNTSCTRITTCSNHGDCNPDGTCKCDTNWLGPKCIIPANLCNNGTWYISGGTQKLQGFIFTYTIPSSTTVCDKLVLPVSLMLLKSKIIGNITFNENSSSAILDITIPILGNAIYKNTNPFSPILWVCTFPSFNIGLTMIWSPGTNLPPVK
jgi:hypothetical protein